MNKADADVVEVPRGWYSRAKNAERQHALQAHRLSRYHLWLGVPVTMLSAIIGTSVFAALGRKVDPGFQIAVGVVSVINAVLAGLHTFLRFAERAERHRTAAAGYAVFRRTVEVLIANRGGDSPPDPSSVRALHERLEELIKAAPELYFSRRAESKPRYSPY